MRMGLRLDYLCASLRRAIVPVSRTSRHCTFVLILLLSLFGMLRLHSRETENDDI